MELPEPRRVQDPRYVDEPCGPYDESEPYGDPLFAQEEYEILPRIRCPSCKRPIRYGRFEDLIRSGMSPIEALRSMGYTPNPRRQTICCINQYMYPPRLPMGNPYTPPHTKIYRRPGEIIPPFQMEDITSRMEGMRIEPVAGVGEAIRGRRPARPSVSEGPARAPPRQLPPPPSATRASIISYDAR